MFKVFILSLAILFLSLNLLAQSPPNTAVQKECVVTTGTRVHNGESSGDKFGTSVAGGYDITGDGTPDYAAGAPYSDACLFNGGTVYLYDGASGGLTCVLCSPEDNALFGYSIDMITDLNNDGKDDLIVGSPNLYDPDQMDQTGGVIVYNTDDWSYLGYFVGGYIGEKRGFSVANAGDVDNGGKPDIIGGSPERNLDGEAFVWSGETLSESPISQLYGEGDGEKFGYSVDGLGDINGDGHSDLIIGAPYNSQTGNRRGRVYLFSGADNLPIRTHWGAGDLDYLGCSVAGIEDINDDGVGDYIVGAYGYDGPGVNTGRAYVFSGADGSTLYELTGESSDDYFGRSVNEAGDVNGDGYPDIMVGAVCADDAGPCTGTAYIYSGGDGSLLIKLYEEDTGNPQYGAAVAGIGDLNGDCFDDVIVGAPLTSITGIDEGRAYAYMIVDNCNPDPECDFVCGDANGDETVNILDITYLIAYLYQGGPPPDPLVSADANGDGNINILDITYLIAYLYQDGPDPIC